MLIDLGTVIAIFIALITSCFVMVFSVKQNAELKKQNSYLRSRIKHIQK